MPTGLLDLLKWIAIALAFLSSGCNDQTSVSVNACASGDMLIPNIELTILGPGLFVLGDSTGDELYSRKGEFCVNKEGHLLHESGLGTKIYSADAGGNISGAITRAVFNINAANGSVLQSVSISQYGVITGHYTLGEEAVLGQLILGNFSSPQNLLAMDGNLCAATPATGNALLGAPGSSSLGSLESGLLDEAYECDRGSMLFNTWLEVNGAGYFVLTKGNRTRYATSLKIGTDAAGYLVDENSYRIMGNDIGQDGQLSTQPGAINLAAGDLPPHPTSAIKPEIKLNGLATTPPTTPFDTADSGSYSYVTSLSVYDSFGSTHMLSLFFVKTVAADIWDLYTFLDGTPIDTVAPLVLTFNSDGSINTPLSATSATYAPIDGSAPITIIFDYSEVTQINGPFDTVSIRQNGYGTAMLTGISFSPDGLTLETYGNGQTVTVARFLLADRPSSIAGQILSPPNTNGLGIIQVTQH